MIEPTCFELIDAKTKHDARSLSVNAAAEKATDRLILLDGSQSYNLNDFTTDRELDRKSMTPVAYALATGYALKAVHRLSDSRAILHFERRPYEPNN